jgi:hypothetical protein
LDGLKTLRNGNFLIKIPTYKKNFEKMGILPQDFYDKIIADINGITNELDNFVSTMSYENPDETIRLIKVMKEKYNVISPINKVRNNNKDNRVSYYVLQKKGFYLFDFDKLLREAHQNIEKQNGGGNDNTNTKEKPVLEINYGPALYYYDGQKVDLYEILKKNIDEILKKKIYNDEHENIYILLLNNFYINNEVLYDNELESLIDKIIDYQMDTNLINTDTSEESSKYSSEIKSDGTHMETDETDEQPSNDFFNFFNARQSIPVYGGGNKGTKREYISRKNMYYIIE